MVTFIKNHENLSQILMDQKLAKLGDAYVNFLYSLALSKKTGEATGVKVKGRLLADAFKKADLRKFLPSRVDRHKQADAAEALIVYPWLEGSMTMEEGLEILEKTEDEVEAFCNLLLVSKTKTKK
ncbi:MAG: hypothetical protein OQK81_01575 [Candidatus Bathyarchaeota archaeon]|nr:hypothetical protein [Candidatus Bathyarchaeota archaeon]